MSDRLLAQSLAELHDLRGLRPAWASDAADQRRLAEIERRERQLRRAARNEDAGRGAADDRQGAGDRLRVARWGVPKVVWQAQRDQEHAWLDQQDALQQERLDLLQRWRDELALLGATEPGDMSQLEQLWVARRRAALAYARALLDRPELRAALAPAVAHDAAATLAAIAPRCAALAQAGEIDGRVLPLLTAALALALEQSGGRS